MALFLALKFSEEEMPKIYDPGSLNDPKVQDFFVVPREGTEDIGFVSAIEYKSSEQLKLRPEPYPRVIRRAKKEEVDSWWRCRVEERRAFVLAKDKARELGLDIKMSHARINMSEQKIVFHFTSEQRIDFRALVKELSALLKKRIELWQIGVRDETRMLDGFGVCGLQTCCSTWLKEFRPISIRMAKEQDINLPPTKLSGQCGRLLCCLSYEVDQYKKMGREAMPKGSTVEFDGGTWVIVDRNLIAGTYLLSDRKGLLKNVKGAELAAGEAKVPEQMKRYGKELRGGAGAASETASDASSADQPKAPDTRGQKDRRSSKPTASAATEQAPTTERTERDKTSAPERETTGRPKKKRRRGRGGRKDKAEAGPKGGQQAGAKASGSPTGEAPAKKSRRRPDRKKKTNEGFGDSGSPDGPKKSGRTGRRGKRRKKPES